MRLGFIGVGPWAVKLATAFRECGAEIVCYDRERRDDYPVWLAHDVNDGKHIPFGSWQNQVSDPDIDALIICAPPDITTEVALACAKVGKRCVATKPLLWSDVPENCWDPPHTQHARYKLPTGHTDCYVDLWRLYSPAWLAMKEELRGKKIAEVSSFFYGNGPKRTFHGALDYGPHAIAHVYDLIGEFKPQSWIKHGEHLDGIWEILSQAGDVRLVDIQIGNGDTRDGPQPCSRYVSVKCHDGTKLEFEEQSDGQHRYFNGGAKLLVDRGVALRRFCRAFMAGEASSTLEYSIAAQRVLERIVDVSQ